MLMVTFYYDGAFTRRFPINEKFVGVKVNGHRPDMAVIESVGIDKDYDPENICFLLKQVKMVLDPRDGEMRARL